MDQLNDTRMLLGMNSAATKIVRLIECIYSGKFSRMKETGYMMNAVAENVGLDAKKDTEGREDRLIYNPFLNVTRANSSGTPGCQVIWTCAI